MPRHGVPLLALLLALVLAACTGEDPDPEPTTGPSSTAAASTPTPSGPAEPVMPAAARKHTEAGAVAFVRYYWDLVSYAQLTQDGSTLADISSPHCAVCNGGQTFLQRVRKKRGEVSGGETSVVESQATKLYVRGKFSMMLVKATTRSRAMMIDYPRGKPDTYPAGEDHVEIILSVRPGGWLVEKLEGTS